MARDVCWDGFKNKNKGQMALTHDDGKGSITTLAADQWIEIIHVKIALQ